MKKLVILDLTKDYSLSVSDAEVFQLSFGKIRLKNCKIVKRNFFSNKNFKIFINDINNLLFNFYKYLNIKNNYDLSCIEVFNQRNDKTQIFNKIYFLNEILKYYKIKKFNKIEIITDDYTFINSYKSIKIKNIKILDISKKKKNTYRVYFLNTLFFHIKALLVILLAKIYTKKQFKYKRIKEGCLSIFPLFYKNNKHKFYDKKKLLNFNFQLTDETHLGNSLSKNFKTLLKIRKIDYTLSVESFIKIPSFLLNFFQSLKKYKLIKKTNNYNFQIKNIEYSEPFRKLFFNSLLNLNKMNIYQSAFNVITDQYKLKKFHLYLFEYNFGYYLNNLIRKNSSKTVIIGYQHGIYSERLMWQNFSKKVNLNKYFPNYIVCKYVFSLNAYRNNFKNIAIKLSDTNKKIIKIKPKKIIENNYNVFTGLHDGYKIINELRNFNDSKIFRIFLHPKMKYKKFINITKNLKINSKKFKVKNGILLSSTSTLPYQLYLKKKYNIIVPRNIIPLNPNSLDSRIFKI